MEINLNLNHGKTWYNPRKKKKNEEREGNVKKCKAQYYLYA